MITDGHYRRATLRALSLPAPNRPGGPHRRLTFDRPKTPYVALPAFHAGGADNFGTPFACVVVEIALTPPATNCNTPANVAAVTPFENGLSLTPANSGGPIYYRYLLTGGTGQTACGSTASSLVPDALVHYDGRTRALCRPAHSK